jgi:hypothetical protein
MLIYFLGSKFSVLHCVVRKVGLYARLDSLNIHDETEIDWKALPHSGWDFWSVRELKRRWTFMKAAVENAEDKTYQGAISRCLFMLKVTDLIDRSVEHHSSGLWRLCFRHGSWQKDSGYGGISLRVKADNQNI